MEEQQDMLSKENDSYENNEKQVDEEKVVIKCHPKKDLVPTYYCNIFVLFIITIAKTFELGLCWFVSGTLITLLFIITGTSVFFSIIFDKNQITTLFKKNERIFYWNELKTIRFERYYRSFSMHDVIYFSKKKSKKPKWLEPSLLFLPFNNSFYVELVDKELYGRDFQWFSYPKYEFLDKLKEWGIKVEIDEKYLKKDPKLRKYVSDDYSEIDVLKTEKKAEMSNEWIIDNHVISYNEYNDNYYIIADHSTVKIVDKKKIEKRGLEVVIKFDNNKYIVTTDNGKIALVKNNRYIDTGRLYIPKKIEYTILFISALPILSCMLIRPLNLFLGNQNMMIILLSLTSMIMITLYLLVKIGKIKL